MKHILKFYFLVLVFVLPVHVALHASVADQDQYVVNKVFLDTANSTRLSSKKKYNQLVEMLEKKADITVTREVLVGKRKVQTSALSLLMRAAVREKRDDNASIKLLVDSKSMLNSWVPAHAPLRIAIKNPQMHSIIPLLVAAKINVALEPAPTGEVFMTYLHELAHYASSGQSGDAAANWMFTILSPLGDVPIDDLDKSNRSAMHMSQSNRDVYQPQFTRLLAEHGASPYCSDETCKTCEPVHPIVKAAHEEFKKRAGSLVLEKVPVKPLAELVIDYCFSKPAIQPIGEQVEQKNESET